jgi:hypothetical protein
MPTKRPLRITSAQARKVAIGVMNRNEKQRKQPRRKPKSARDLAEEIADVLFAAGLDYEADHLGLMDICGNSHGQWNKPAVVNRITKILEGKP